MRQRNVETRGEHAERGRDLRDLGEAGRHDASRWLRAPARQIPRRPKGNVVHVARVAVHERLPPAPGVGRPTLSRWFGAIPVGICRKTAKVSAGPCRSKPPTRAQARERLQEGARPGSARRRERCAWTLLDRCGGTGGIRTPGAFRPGRFQGGCIRPLCHRSVGHHRTRLVARSGSVCGANGRSPAPADEAARAEPALAVVACRRTCRLVGAVGRGAGVAERGALLRR